jgi:hypothetical protein
LTGCSLESGPRSYMDWNAESDCMRFLQSGSCRMCRRLIDDFQQVRPNRSGGYIVSSPVPPRRSHRRYYSAAVADPCGIRTAQDTRNEEQFIFRLDFSRLICKTAGTGIIISKCLVSCRPQDPGTSRSLPGCGRRASRGEAGCGQRVGDQRAVAAPRHGFCAHHRRCFPPGDGDELFQSVVESVRLHVIREAAE